MLSIISRDIYQHWDTIFLILVEDVWLENIIDENALYRKLINILPSGGWENVLKMQDDISSQI